MGPTVAAIDLAVAPTDWAALGFAVEAERCAVGNTLLRLGRDASGGGAVAGWALRDATTDGDVDGIATEHATWPQPPPAEHPNGALGVDHVVVTTPDVPRTFAALDQTGMTLRRERTAGDRRYGFFRHGECIVEVVGPTTPEDGPASLWGLTVTVGDLDATAVLLGERLGRVKDAVQPGRRIATVRSSGVPLAFMSA